MSTDRGEYLFKIQSVQITENPRRDISETNLAQDIIRQSVSSLDT